MSLIGLFSVFDCPTDWMNEIILAHMYFIIATASIYWYISLEEFSDNIKTRSTETGIQPLSKHRKKKLISLIAGQPVPKAGAKYAEAAALNYGRRDSYYESSLHIKKFAPTEYHNQWNNKRKFA